MQYNTVTQSPTSSDSSPPLPMCPAIASWVSWSTISQAETAPRRPRTENWQWANLTGTRLSTLTVRAPPPLSSVYTGFGSSDMVSSNRGHPQSEP